MFVAQSDEAFNIQLEILKDCGYSCQDCAIDKSKTSDYMRVGDDDLLIRAVDEFKDHGFRLHEFTLGPTDIISSKSGLGIFDRYVVQELTQRYDSLTVSLALLFDRQLVELARTVDRVMRGKKFRLIVPLTIRNAHNEKFLNLIRQRIKVIKDNLFETDFYMVYIGINMVNASAEAFNFDNNKLVHDLDVGVHQTVEYNFPHSRMGLEQHRAAFLNDLQAFINGLHETVDRDANYNRFLVPNIKDSIETIYYQGDLYYVPSLIEKFPLFEPTFKLARPYSMSSILQFKYDLYTENLLEYSDKQPCSDCCFVDECARGDIHVIMRKLNHNQCLLDMKNRWDQPTPRIR